MISAKQANAMAKKAGHICRQEMEAWVGDKIVAAAEAGRFRARLDTPEFYSTFRPASLAAATLKSILGSYGYGCATLEAIEPGEDYPLGNPQIWAVWSDV